MADKLAKVRSEFVKSVNTEMVKQLLDDLLEDGVLNDGEKDSILEENSSRADKARCLIDVVKKKGDTVSNKMIAHLQSRDPALCSKLGLTQSPPAQKIKGPTAEEQWASSLLTTPDGFWKMKTKDNSVYPVSVNSIRNRVALLITNIHFADARLNRKGAETDEQNMEKLLTNLGYNVVKYTNLTKQQMDNALKEFSKHPKLKETDSVFVVIMSHGKLGALIGVNDHEGQPDEFLIDDIYKHLGSEKCPALMDKPKVIIIQACRGTQRGAVEVSDGSEPEVSSDDVSQDGNIEDDSLKIVHKEKDFISLLSSTPDTVSYRNTEKGSYLIQFVVEVFNTFSCEEHIEELFRMVMQRFEDLDLNDKKQMPTKDRCTLTKLLYLFPGKA